MPDIAACGALVAAGTAACMTDCKVSPLLCVVVGLVDGRCGPPPLHAATTTVLAAIAASRKEKRIKGRASETLVKVW
jgi:hypothetical protein